MERYLITYLPRLDPRLHLVALLAPFIVVVAASWVYVLGPDWREVAKLRASRAILAEVLDSGAEITNELATTRQSVARLENHVFGKNMNLPMKQLEAQIIGRLQEISSRNHVELDGVRPGAKKRLRMFVESPIEVEVAGDYFDIARWLQELSGEFGFIVVKQYEMQPITQDTTPRLRMKMTMVSYRTEEM
jgi:type IV pilus assembly protein PilO